jgi:16S rRNA (guanine527-N7)-methyltransferase
MTASSAAPDLNVSRETLQRLDRFVQLLLDENTRQSLVSEASIPDVWSRHVADGAQLFALGNAGSWCDIGSGPGLPGIVIAIMGGTPMTLVEPRRLRAEFLRRVIDDLGLSAVEVECCKIERVQGKFDNLTARAVASLPRLFSMAEHVTHNGTRWVLPKGETVKSELDDACRTWQGSFRLVPSRTNAKSAIVIAEHVRRRGNR